MKKISVSMSQLESILGWVYFVFQLLFLGLILMIVNTFLPHPLSITELNILLFMINFVAIILIFPKFLGKNLKNALNSFPATLKIACYGFLLYYGFSILVNFVVLFIDPDFANVNDNSIAEMLQENNFLMSLCTVVLVPVVEETLYRGLIFRSIYNRSPILGYILSTVLFAAIHVVGYIGSYDAVTLGLCFLQYIPAGVFLGWAYAKADTIWAPIMIHMTVNQIGIIAAR